jgi:hypothetical protein
MIYKWTIFHGYVSHNPRDPEAILEHRWADVPAEISPHLPRQDRIPAPAALHSQPAHQKSVVVWEKWTSGTTSLLIYPKLK